MVNGTATDTTYNSIVSWSLLYSDDTISGGNTYPASHVSYDNTESGLDADNAQDAIDELKANGLGGMIKLTGTTSQQLFTALNGMTEDQKNRCVIALTCQGYNSVFRLHCSAKVQSTGGFVFKYTNVVSATYTQQIVLSTNDSSIVLIDDKNSTTTNITITSWKILYQDDSVSGGNTYPASQVTLESGGTVEDRFDAINLGNVVNVHSYTENAPYTCPSDGYFYIAHSSPGGVVIAGIKSGTTNRATYASAAYTNSKTGYNSIFVKKGMRLFLLSEVGGTATISFYPLE